MSVTLGTELQTAQDGNLHKMVVELLSYTPNSPIPFVGYKIADITPEYRPKLTVLSSGRAFYVYGNSAPDVRFGYTDVDRTVWTHGQLFTNVDFDNETFRNSAVVERTDGTILVLIVVETYELYYQIVNADMTIGASGLITTWADIENDLDVTLLDDTTYLYARAGGSFGIYTSTSADGITWSGETLVTPTGMGTNPIGNPSLLQDAGGDLFCYFDNVDSYSGSGEPLVNLYYIKSTNNGTSWETPVAVTSFDSYGVVGYNPVVIQHEADQILLAYRKEQASLYMDNSAPGWGSNEGSSNLGGPNGLMYDPVNNKIVYIGSGFQSGNKYGMGTTLIDVATWTIEDTWNGTTTPELPTFDLGFNELLDSSNSGAIFNGKFAVMSSTAQAVFIIDTIGDTVSRINFTGDSQNITWGGAGYLTQMYVDSNGKIWLNFRGSENSTIGWIDINALGPTYSLNDEFPSSGEGPLTWAHGLIYWDVDVASNRSSLVTGWPSGGFLSGTRLGIFDTVSGARLNLYSMAAYPDMPQKWWSCSLTQGNYAYMCFDQSAEDPKRGICRINLSTDAVDYLIPPWSVALIATEIHYVPEINCLAIVTTAPGGLVTYNITTGEWLQYNNATIPELAPYGDPSFRFRYNVIDDMFIMGARSGTYSGVVMFPRSGEISQIMYTEGTYNAGTWEFGAEAKLVTDVNAYTPSLAYVPGSNEFYSMWEDYISGTDERFIRWDRNELYGNLSSYLVESKDIALDWSVGDSPARLSFGLKDGHLFDPYNLNSLLRTYTMKGRKLTIRIGEKVGGTDYWAAQGSFYVTTRKYSLAKGQYPVMDVQAENLFSIIGSNEIVATSYLSAVSPEFAFAKYAEDWGGFSAGDIVDISFDGSFTMDVQFIDKTFYDVLFTIANRFGYVPRLTHDNQLTAVKIGDGAIDHTYTTNDSLFSFSPDDSFSDFTNTIIVHGEESGDTQVTYPEEKVADLTGTFGWWGGKTDYDITYSEDKEKRVQDPRLKVINTITGIGFELGGSVEEYMSFVDPNDQYCTVTVEAPNLIPALVVAIGTIFGSTLVGDVVVYGKTIPVGSYVCNIGIIAALTILGSIGSFQYEVWGKPIGYIRRSMQNDASAGVDQEMIEYLGHVVTKEIDGWQCTDQAKCGAYADLEMATIKWQRERIVIDKVGHLQDEESDTIRYPHPYSQQNLDIFITDLRRRLKLGSGGYFKDTIEGWVL
jgi:hypothetical protein